LDVDRNAQSFLQYCPFFVYQTFPSASFVLLKVLKNQYFAAFVEAEAGKKLFNLSVTAIRKMSVSNNDLPGRLRDVLAYLWSHADTQIISGVGRDRIAAEDSGSNEYERGV
jgi:transcriptional regulatory protein LEU3